VEFITEAVGMMKLTRSLAGLCVLAFDSRHIFTAYFFGVDVCHEAKLNALYCFFPKIKNQSICWFAVVPLARGLTCGADRYVSLLPAA
jgi:hypothetical protein